jgi:hypothetical protein
MIFNLFKSELNFKEHPDILNYLIVEEAEQQWNYHLKEDKDGNILNEPEHEFSHSMDAIRYKFVQLLGKPAVINAVASKPIDYYYPELGI